MLAQRKCYTLNCARPLQKIKNKNNSQMLKPMLGDRSYKEGIKELKEVTTMGHNRF